MQADEQVDREKQQLHMHRALDKWQPNGQTDICEHRQTGAVIEEWNLSNTCTYNAQTSVPCTSDMNPGACWDSDI